MSDHDERDRPESVDPEECVGIGVRCLCLTDISFGREEFKPAALDDDDDEDEVSGGELEGSVANESEDKSGGASAQGDAHQTCGDDNASEGGDEGRDKEGANGKVKSEAENPSPSQLSLSQMREKIAALEKVRTFDSPLP
jgi:hypothetical protein